MQLAEVKTYAVATPPHTCSANFLIQERIGQFDGFHAYILEKPLVGEDGTIIPATDSGLGVVLNEAVAAAHRYTS